MASSSSVFLSTSSSSFFIFFLYLSMHACNCNARNIRVTNISDCPTPNVYCKIAEKIKVSNDIFHQGINKIDGYQHDSPSSRIPVEFDARFGSEAKEEEEDARTKAGRKVVESTPRENFLKATKNEVSGGSAAEIDKVEAVRSQNNIGHEHITEPDDYQPPHRNSPIHNK